MTKLRACFVDGLDVFGSQRNSGIIPLILQQRLQSLLLARGCDSNFAFAQIPLDKNGRVRNTILGREGVDDIVDGSICLCAQWNESTVACHTDTMLFAILHKLWLLQIGVELDLIQNRLKIVSRTACVRDRATTM
jgi:hypothetical protein